MMYFSEKKYNAKNGINHRTWWCNWKHASVFNLRICSSILGESFSLGDFYNQCHRMFFDWFFYRHFRKTAIGQQRLEVVSNYWILWRIYYFFNFWIRKLQFVAKSERRDSLCIYCLECYYRFDGGMVWTFCCENVIQYFKKPYFRRL